MERHRGPKRRQDLAGEEAQGLQGPDPGRETAFLEHHAHLRAQCAPVGDRVEAAYRRGDLLEKRIAFMKDWDAYCSAAPVKAVNKSAQLPAKPASKRR